LDAHLPTGHAPLTPTSFLDRSAYVYGERIAVVDGDRRLTYHQLRDRCLAQASVLRDLGVEVGDRVAVLARNSLVMLESHYGVPYAGAVLVALNVRLSVDELRYIVEHAGCTVIFAEPELRSVAEQISGGVRVVSGDEYELALRRVSALPPHEPDEYDLLAINYTSGTTGRPKGVMYHHRGAYLQALAMRAQFELTSRSGYLWTLPMFHCNGWCFTWAVTLAGGTHFCMPRVDAAPTWQILHEEDITHFCAAPTVLIGLVNDAAASPLDGRRVAVAVGGAPPTPRLLEQCDRLGFDVTHLYGLTETFGPIAICDWQDGWNSLGAGDRARLKARQGVANIVSDRLRVVDPNGDEVPHDGASLGEITVRGNNVMLGYFRDPEATAAATGGGRFHTGDLAVVHPDGYVEIRDRAKDVIISGGENISSVEVEAALATHPAVLESAVFPTPDEKWGERPVAVVTLKPGAAATEDELKAHVRSLIAAFKVPVRFEFGDLPKTASGKIRKYELRQRERERSQPQQGQ
jgi:fatty-acyl-CoA synthase